MTLNYAKTELTNMSYVEESQEFNQGNFLTIKTIVSGKVWLIINSNQNGNPTDEIYCMQIKMDAINGSYKVTTKNEFMNVKKEWKLPQLKFSDNSTYD